MKSVEEAGGEDDTKHLEQGNAKADRANEEQVLGNLSREPEEMYQLFKGPSWCYDGEEIQV